MENEIKVEPGVLAPSPDLPEDIMLVRDWRSNRIKRIMEWLLYRVLDIAFGDHPAERRDEILPRFSASWEASEAPRANPELFAEGRAFLARTEFVMSVFDRSTELGYLSREGEFTLRSTFVIGRRPGLEDLVVTIDRDPGGTLDKFVPSDTFGLSDGDMAMPAEIFAEGLAEQLSKMYFSVDCPALAWWETQ